MNTTQVLPIVLAATAFVQFPTSGAESAPPIPPPPQDRSLHGWCLWAQGDWADGFGTYGAKLKTRATYPLISSKTR